MTSPLRPRRSGPFPGAHGRRDDVGFAIVYALSFMLLVLTCLLMLLAQLTEEFRVTAFAHKHEQTLNSAMAGLNAGLSQLRNAVDKTTGAGVVANLLCPAGSNHATITGALDTAGTNSWVTDVYYLSTDPAGMILGQMSPLPCPLTSVPLYAYIVSVGTAPLAGSSSSSLGDRTLHATYSFTTTNAGNAGGQISYGGNCWDAGSNPTAGTVVTFQPCQATGTPAQIWSYRVDLSMQWQGDDSKNLCLDYRGIVATPSSSLVTLQTCLGSGMVNTAYNSATPGYPIAGQQYQEFSEDTDWHTVTATGDTDGNYCVTSLAPATPTYSAGNAGDQLVVAVKCYQGASRAAPAKGVGAGAAAGITSGLPGPTQQVVNLEYTTTCVDVNGSNPAGGLLTWPCHQAPDPAKISGNQAWQYSGTTTMPGTFTSSRTGYYSTVCLQSTGSALSLVSCVTGLVAQQWTMTGYVSGDYPGSYLIRDYLGNCLQSDGTVAFASIHACNGKDVQKWNAPPGGAQSLLRAVGEK